MNEIQLEFNIDEKSDVELKLGYMQKKLEEMHESMGKVRRKLFSEMTEIKKENLRMKQIIEDLSNEKITWVYGEGDSLFNVSKHKEAIG